MAKLLEIQPVLPSANIERDVKWYQENLGFECWSEDNMYAVLKREHLWIHLQWHANTEDDPLLGGSVIKIFVEDIKHYFSEFLERGVVEPSKLNMDTPWGTNEFGFYDLNNNAIFIVEDR